MGGVSLLRNLNSKKASLKPQMPPALWFPGLEAELLQPPVRRARQEMRVGGKSAFVSVPLSWGKAF